MSATASFLDTLRDIERRFDELERQLADPEVTSDPQRLQEIGRERAEIERLRKERNAVILAHYYQKPEIQDLADYIGDSLELSKKAAATDADVIVFCGVKFMAETAKILAPEKIVVLPDMNAGCSLEDACPPEKFAQFRDMCQRL